MDHTVCSNEDWLRARRELLAKEKAFTRTRDELSAARRALPWTRVERDYVFESVEGKKTLAELFDGQSQLLVYHFMFAPEWEAGCKSCSLWADGFEGIVPHLAQRDVTFTAISRAPIEKLQAYAKRLGWTFPWVSSHGTTFNYDYGVSFAPEELVTGQIDYNFGKHKAFGTEMPGISVFCRDDDGNVFRAYSCYSRGIDMVNATYQLLDLVPKGRDEDGLPYPMAWVRIRDEYGR